MLLVTRERLPEVFWWCYFVVGFFFCFVLFNFVVVAFFLGDLPACFRMATVIALFWND